MENIFFNHNNRKNESGILLEKKKCKEKNVYDTYKEIGIIVNNEKEMKNISKQIICYVKDKIEVTKITTFFVSAVNNKSSSIFTNLNLITKYGIKNIILFVSKDYDFINNLVLFYNKNKTKFNRFIINGFDYKNNNRYKFDIKNKYDELNDYFFKNEIIRSEITKDFIIINDNNKIKYANDKEIYLSNINYDNVCGVIVNILYIVNKNKIKDIYKDVINLFKKKANSVNFYVEDLFLWDENDFNLYKQQMIEVVDTYINEKYNTKIDFIKRFLFTKEQQLNIVKYKQYMGEKYYFDPKCKNIINEYYIEDKCKKCEFTFCDLNNAYFNESICINNLCKKTNIDYELLLHIYENRRDVFYAI